MYESKDAPLASRRRFAKRVIHHTAAATALVAAFGLLGVLGQILLEETLTVHDALLNTALLLGGIGTHSMPPGTPGKLFIAGYGFLTGILFAASLGIIMAPVVHRLVHKFHLDSD